MNVKKKLRNENLTKNNDFRKSTQLQYVQK